MVQVYLNFYYFIGDSGAGAAGFRGGAGEPERGRGQDERATDACAPGRDGRGRRGDGEAADAARPIKVTGTIIAGHLA